MLFAICTCIQLFTWINQKMHLFSANQIHIIFSSILLYSTKDLEIFKLVNHYLKVCIKIIMTIGYLKCTICSLEIKWTRSDLLRVLEFMPNKDVWFKFPLPLIKNLSLIITIKINFISYFLIHELHICSVNEGCFIHQQTKLYFYFSCGWYDINSICVSFYSNLNRA